MNDLRKFLSGIASIVLIFFFLSKTKDCRHEHEIGYNTIIEEDANSYSTSTLEAKVIAEVNKCRRNPAQYADEVLVPYLNSMCGGNFSSQWKKYPATEGEAAVHEAISVLRSRKPLCQLEYSDSLYMLAKEHCETQGPVGCVGHDSANGVSFEQRLTKLGLKGCGENIAYGTTDAKMILIQLLIDDGEPSRGHRENILRPEYRKIGVACGEHRKYGFMCVLDFQC